MDSIQCYGTRAKFVGKSQPQTVSAEGNANYLPKCVVAQSGFWRHIVGFDEL
ncbi:MAG: hypothetical protein WBW71_16225 [Bacteroidota bacterium]